VIGNFTIANTNVTLQVVYTGQPVLNVTGIASLSGTLVLLLDNLTLNISSFLVVGFAANLSHPFDRVILQSSTCVHYTAGPMQYRKSSSTDNAFGVLVQSVSNTCHHSTVQWFVYVIPIAGVLLLIGVVLLLAFKCAHREHFRYFLRTSH